MLKASRYSSHRDLPAAAGPSLPREKSVTRQWRLAACFAADFMTSDEEGEPQRR